ncbi:hypothetical protein BRCON_1065 [Candidatus Sumerlaea chitinivorans]|uniref:Uncharacterized protein n=1 Tax=Sumerlaea chitinivorans TaxID=2250252 RepID=A0A2Z4Y547_SUMC1|nr:hypothetical protein BRCON_1065 [Candidatus Sumerlaea chitinivorans]
MGLCDRTLRSHASAMEFVMNTRFLMECPSVRYAILPWVIKG